MPRIVRNQPRLMLACLNLLLLAALSACNNGGGTSSLANREVLAPRSVRVGEPLSWNVELSDGEESRSTVFDANNAIVFHRDYNTDGQFQWTPFQPGSYLVRVDVKNITRQIAIGQTMLEVLPRGGPAVTGTIHPLVALYTYSIPIGRDGDVTYTCDSCAAIGARSFTTPRSHGAGSETGVLLPALRPSSDYSVRHTIYEGSRIEELGPELRFSTGPVSVTLPTVDVITPATNPVANALLAVSAGGKPSIIVDDNATPVWYASGGESVMRPTGSGWTSILLAAETRILDYTGQAVRSLPLQALNHQLVARGFPATSTVHHEVRPLPNGRYAIFGLYDRLETDKQGPGIVDVLADTIIVLDDQMQVVWTWDAFDHLDVSRPSVLNDTIAEGTLGIHLNFGDTANDWTHMNAIDYDPRDGNLIVSVRNQSWVIKIAYENGTGDGHILWRLGEGGDFTIVSTDPDPWFGYQHDANLLTDGRLALFDNGNPRNARTGGNSRGQVYVLDEKARTATLDVCVDLGVYSFALGSAALTRDGSYHFNAGVPGLHDDVAADGTLHGSFHTRDVFVYRSFRLGDPFDTGAN